MDLNSMLTSALTGAASEKIAWALGVENTTAKKMIAMGMPLLLAQLSKNSQTEAGATALNNALDKHKEVPNDVTSLIGSEDAMKMLGHIFSGKQSTVASKLAEEAGVSEDQAGGMLTALAPMLIGALGQQKATSGGMDTSALAGLLDTVSKDTSEKSLLSSLATGLLDKDGDGDIKDDLLGMGMAWVQKKFMS